MCTARQHPVPRAGRVAATAVAVIFFLAGCAAVDDESVVTATAVACAPDNDGLTLPPGFCAVEFADGLGAPRHLVVRDDGVVFAAIRNREGAPGGVVALRDADGDGEADERERFGGNGGTGIALIGDSLLYLGTDDAVLRYRIPRGALTPRGAPDTIVYDLPSERSHAAKSISIEGSRLFVNHGAPSNSCQVADRQAGSPGQDPCPELATRAGVWVYDAHRLRQRPQDGQRFATGTRNLVAQTIGPDGDLYAVQHGRDQLGASWGFTDERSAELPAEELLRVEAGDNYGWPYCYYDAALERRVLAPEYGGDGVEVGRCGGFDLPIETFPAHWAPNAVVFYEAAQFPERYHGGAFIAFHGSWNRAPLPQGGYNVVFVPFAGGQPAGDWEVFADGFAGGGPLPGDADHRPSGLAVGPDGSLYVGDDTGGSIWRIVYPGEGIQP